MPAPRLRPMTATDIPAATAAILADDWGDRGSWFRFAVGHDRCDVLAAEHDGQIVGTAVATHNGPAAWIGTIWVASSWRRRGVGLALTEAAMEAATIRGAATLVLVATDAGRPLYERLGFEVASWYVTVEAPGRGNVPGTGAGRGDGRVRAYRPGDLPHLLHLDRTATGEDRGHLLEAFAGTATASVVVDATDTPTGFLVRPPWGGGATIAPAADDAMALLGVRRDGYPADRKVRAGLLHTNAAGLERLRQEGWTEAWRAPRLQRGTPLTWIPDAIWGQFNHALG